MSVLISGWNATREQVNRAIQYARGETTARIILVANEPSSLLAGDDAFVSCHEQKMSECFAQAAAYAGKNLLICLDSRIDWAPNSLREFAGNASTANADFTFAGMELAGDIIELNDFAVENIPLMISYTDTWPFGLAALNAAAFNDITLSGGSLEEVLGELFINAITDGKQVERTSSNVRSNGSDREEISLTLSNETRSAILSAAINNVNIEDLFPTHPWSTHQAESAAASFHSLAAIFLRLGDSESAQQCLSYSDELEDSPRSLALKGLIALIRGETLGAVANMVSSLQQYELRKRNDGSHYLSFEPADLNVINSNLNDGLSALNKRENDKAVECFTEAVFHFDSFFRDFGLDSLREGRES